MESNEVDPARKRRSETEWCELVAAFRSSGMTRRAWCKEQGLAYESLRRWTKRLRGGPISQQFVEICRTTRIGDADGQVRVRVCKGGEIELLGNISEELLHLVLRVMRESVDVH